MSEIKHTPPELEAVELEAVGWFVRTKRTNEDSAGWLIADCSTAAHGRAWATLFAAAPRLLAALTAIRSIEFGHSEADICAVRMECDAALAAAEGRTEEKEG